MSRARTILPALATLRRRTGLPHRIIVDEAHYVLHGQLRDVAASLGQTVRSRDELIADNRYPF